MKARVKERDAGLLDTVLERLEDLEDGMRVLRSQMNRKYEDLLPDELVGRLLAGEHPVKVWRTHRGLTLAQLAQKSAIAAGYISEIENGKKPGSVDAMKKLAAALDLEIDDVVR